MRSGTIEGGWVGGGKIAHCLVVSVLYTMRFTCCPWPLGWILLAGPS